MLSEQLSVYKEKRVLVTGNTGFKGSWLCQWLLKLGAEVFGYALEPPTQPSLFRQLSLEGSIRNKTEDICNYPEFKSFITAVKPDIIFHLAAQSLVRPSYEDPLGTFQTNVMGTANLLEAIRESGIRTTVILVTSDKCYENNEWLFGYREVDPLGGYDPYSASKGAAELVISSWRRSFFNPIYFDRHGVKIASVRAGNVIGGGDWAKDRIVPDCIRYLTDTGIIKVRNPKATRPWQHVLEPLGGYLILGSRLLNSEGRELEMLSSAFNFGPLISSNRSVEVLVREILKYWGNGTWETPDQEAVHEASLLNLTIDKAYHLLNWQPLWDFETTIQKTVEWYHIMYEAPEQIISKTVHQIEEYMNSF